MNKYIKPITLLASSGFRPRSAFLGFTLLELLVVIAIITLLLGLVSPALRKALEATRVTVCKTHLKELTRGVLFYAEQYSGFLPPLDNLSGNPDWADSWWHKTGPFLAGGEQGNRAWVFGALDETKNKMSDDHVSNHYHCPLIGHFTGNPYETYRRWSAHYSMNDNLTAMRDVRTDARGNKTLLPYRSFSGDFWLQRMRLINLDKVRPATILLGDGRVYGSSVAYFLPTFNRQYSPAASSSSNQTPWPVAPGGQPVPNIGQVWYHGGAVNLSAVDGSVFDLRGEWDPLKLEGRFGLN